MRWIVGETDTAANAGDGFDAKGAATTAEAWFRGLGMNTKLDILPGLGHDLDGRFGGYVAGVLDDWGYGL